MIVAPNRTLRLGGLQSPASTLSADIQAYEFLVDTGADCTCISPAIVQQLNLVPDSQRLITTPSGVAPANVYIVDIAIPFGAYGLHICESQVVFEFNGSNSFYEGLIGRDVICLGVLTLSFDGHLTFAL